MSPPDPASEQRIATLRRRWEQERSATASMPLAEEYRRLGRRDDAAAVLEAALRSQPRHTALQVALGRCRLESGNPQGALSVLREVLERDPLQLVANQLTVDALIAAGDAKAAAECLASYQALNARDPKIPDWRRRIAALAVPSETTVATPVERSIPVPSSPVTDAEMLFDLEPTEVAEGTLDALVDDEASSETLFPELCDEAFLEPSRRALDQIWQDLLGTGQPVPSETPSGPEPATTAAELSQVESGPVTAPEPETVLEPEPVAAPRPPATVTLGELYLQQGHVAEAESIFEEVLAQDPGNLAAAEGLHALREALAQPVAETEAENQAEDLADDQDATISGTWAPALESIASVRSPLGPGASSPTWEAIDIPAPAVPQAIGAATTSPADSQERLRQRVRLLRRYLQAVDRLRRARVH